MSGRHRQPSAPGRHRKPPKRAHLVVPVVSAVGVLGVGGVSAAAALSGGNGGNPPVPMPRVVPGLVVGPPQSATPLPTPAASTPPAAASSPAAARTARPAVNGLRLTVVGKVSWVQVVGPHGRVLYVGMLRHGRSLTFAQRPLVVTLGDAGAVEVRHGVTVYRRAGRAGEVRRFRVV